MADMPPVPGPTLAEKREKTVQLLIDSFASDRLTVEEFEDRLDKAHRAEDMPSLDSLVQDLPAVAAAAAPSPPASPASPAPATRSTPARANPADVRDHQLLVAIMGGVERKGPWTPARKSTVLAMMGGAELDFREAIMPPGVTEIDIFTLMGGVEILVPPGIAVDASGLAIMGGFSHGPGRPPGMQPDDPIIRVRGFAMMGGVDIQVRLPGETARDARRRQRDERRQLRGDQRRRLR